MIDLQCGEDSVPNFNVPKLLEALGWRWRVGRRMVGQEGGLEGSGSSACRSIAHDH
jgi:hypothetical protein